jgi:adenylate kinase
MIVVFVGAPGAGKGTQASLLEKELGYRKVSTGDVLRKNIREKTEIGKQAEAIMARGELVSDDVLKEIVRGEMNNHQEKLLLDGYPRNVTQAGHLEEIRDGHEIVAAVHFDVAKDELIRRLAGRRVCGSCGAVFHVDDQPPKKSGFCDACGSNLVQRPDDAEANVKTRLEVYDRETKPVLNYYKNQGKYLKIDANASPQEVFERVKKSLGGPK